MDETSRELDLKAVMFILRHTSFKRIHFTGEQLVRSTGGRSASLLDLSDDILVRIMCFLDPRDRFSMLVSCKSVYYVCVSAFYSMTPLLLRYDGTKAGSKKCNATLQFLERNEKIMSQVQAMLYCRSEQHTALKRLRSRVWGRVPQIPRALDSMTRLVTLTIEITSVSDLVEVANSLPLSLKRLVLVLNVPTKTITREPDWEISEYMPKLAYLSIVSRREIVYSEIHTSLLAAFDAQAELPGELARQRYMANTRIQRVHRRSGKQPSIATVVSALVESSKDTLLQLELKRIDACLIFSRFGTRSIVCPKLRLLVLDNTSCVFLLKWFPFFDLANCAITRGVRLVDNHTRPLIAPLIVCIMHRRKNRVLMKECSTTDRVWTGVVGNEETIVKALKGKLGLLY